VDLGWILIKSSPGSRRIRRRRLRSFAPRVAGRSSASVKALPVFAILVRRLFRRSKWVGRSGKVLQSGIAFV
jgi:hypothetical protein